MSNKKNENSMLIYRPKKRRNFVLDTKNDQKSHNLK